MKIQYTTPCGRITVELEGKTQTDIFEQLAEFQEVFGNLTCTRNGKSSDKVKFVVREDKEENKYYELHCYDDDPELQGARLTFGQNKKGGTLYPKRRETEGDGDEKKVVYLPNNGWLKWNPKTKKNE